MQEPPSYSKLPSRIFFLKQSVCVRGEEEGTEGCMHLLSLILGLLAAICYANGNTKENRGGGFGFMYGSKTGWLADFGKCKHRYGCFSVFRNTL